MKVLEFKLHRGASDLEQNCSCLCPNKTFLFLSPVPEHPSPSSILHPAAAAAAAAV